jgi:hypothetical protein
MKHVPLALFAMAMAVAIAPSALADPILGSLGVSGGNDQWTATGITFSNPSAIARDATGAYATVLGASPATNPATIDSTTFSFATPDVLVFTVGTGTATFTATGPIDLVLDTGEFLLFSGTGTLTLNGYDTTKGTFSFSSTDSSDNFGTSGSSTYGFDVTATPTPEPGSLVLLGTGLFGMAVFAYRKSKRPNLVMDTQ